MFGEGVPIVQFNEGNASGYVERVGGAGFVACSNGVEEGGAELVGGSEEGANVGGGFGVEDCDGEVSVGEGEVAVGGGGGDGIECVGCVFYCG